MADPLASSDDVKAALGRDLTSSETLRVGDILKRASDLFRREAKQTFTPDTSTVRLRVFGCEVYLPERPVVSVASVVDDCGSAVSYSRAGQTLTLGSFPGFVTVTYAHGDSEVPDLVRTTIADIARRVLTAPEAVKNGATRTTDAAGPFSSSIEYATWAQGGQTRLAPDDAELARGFRPPRRAIIVQEAPVGPIQPRWRDII